MKRVLLLAIALIACMDEGPKTPAWLIAQPGNVAFTSSGEEDSPTTPVCSTVALYHRYTRENGAKGCVEQPQGVKVRIDAIVPAKGRDFAVAEIYALNGRFRGYTAVWELLPAIPPGVAVTLAPAANEHLTISPNQRAELDDGLELGAQVPAFTVRFDPTNSDKRDLLVRIAGGKYVGKSGWLFARQAFIGDLPLDQLTFARHIF